MTLRLLSPSPRAGVSRALLLSLLLAAACSAPQQRVDPQAWLADVAWLADDARQGRDTDSPELVETAHWVADRFEAAGLQPLGDDGGWLQRFTVPGRRRLVDGNVLKVDASAQAMEGAEEDAEAVAETITFDLELHEDWIPLQSALNAQVTAPMIFAGYGLSDPEGGWDDYAGLDVKGKIAVVLRRGPRSGEAAARYAEGRGRERVNFVAKVNDAFRHGAAGLIVVNDPTGTEIGSRSDRPTEYRPLRGDGVAASLPAANVTGEAGSRFVSALGRDLAAIQRELDETGRPMELPLNGRMATLVVASEAPQIESFNVVGWLPGSDPALAGEYVLIGAHMDHVGLGMRAVSRGGSAAQGQIHNGADDNASGTAGVVELAGILANERDSLRRSVVLACWSGEEWGLLGSRHFAGSPPPGLPLEKLVAAVNMDMIGRGRDGYVVVEGMGSSPGFRELLVSAHDALGLRLDLNLSDQPSSNSDHASFFEKRVPVINFFTGLHDDYHMPGDDVEKVDAVHGAAIASLAGEVVRRLAQAEQRPLFTELPGTDNLASAHAAPPAADGTSGAHGGPGERAADQPPGTPTVSAYRVVLGTSPDMGYQKDDGVRISGVRKDTPAERAGLLPGDLIVALDGQQIRNLEDYSVLLFSHQPGDVIKLRVRRGEELLELQATLTGQAGDG